LRFTYLARIAAAAKATSTAVAGRVQAEGGPPRASSGRLRTLPEPPPPRALHAGEHPSHDDHSRR